MQYYLQALLSICWVMVFVMYWIHAMGNKLLEVEDLRISFPTTRGIAEVVRGVSFSVGKEKLVLLVNLGRENR